MVKRGINETRAEKSGPTVKKGITRESKDKKIIKCACGAVLEKSCPDPLTCEISSVTCPNCGRSVS